jgi:hypothetical protein
MLHRPKNKEGGQQKKIHCQLPGIRAVMSIASETSRLQSDLL